MAAVVLTGLVRYSGKGPVSGRLYGHPRDAGKDARVISYSSPEYLRTRIAESPSFPGYHVTADGRVIGKRGAELTQFKRGKGYMAVKICCRHRKRNVGVHVLVCEAFHGPRPTPRHHAAHSDGNKTNNNSTNLSWKTPKENVQDQVRAGSFHVLTHEDRAKGGETSRRLFSKEAGVGGRPP